MEEKDLISDRDPTLLAKPKRDFNGDYQDAIVDLEGNNATKDNDTHISEPDGNDSASSFHNHGQLRLPTGALVPNCCAICLGDYEVNDQVVWSSNSAHQEESNRCPHAFHQECILDWLIRMQPATPCPCCRLEFTDWEEMRRARKIVWTAENAFNLQTIRF